MEIRKATAEDVRRVIAEVSGVNIERVQPETSLRGDLGMDSLELADLLVTLESEFEGDLYHQPMGHILTVQNVMDALQ